MNHKVVCRTAPATEGLLSRLGYLKCSYLLYKQGLFSDRPYFIPGHVHFVTADILLVENTAVITSGQGATFFLQFKNNNTHINKLVYIGTNWFILAYIYLKKSITNKLIYATSWPKHGNCINKLVYSSPWDLCLENFGHLNPFDHFGHQKPLGPLVTFINSISWNSFVTLAN